MFLCCDWLFIEHTLVSLFWVWLDYRNNSSRIGVFNRANYRNRFIAQA